VRDEENATLARELSLKNRELAELNAELETTT